MLPARPQSSCQLTWQRPSRCSAHTHLGVGGGGLSPVQSEGWGPPPREPPGSFAGGPRVGSPSPSPHPRKCEAARRSPPGALAPPLRRCCHSLCPFLSILQFCLDSTCHQEMRTAAHPFSEHTSQSLPWTNEMRQPWTSILVALRPGLARVWPGEEAVELLGSAFPLTATRGHPPPAGRKRTASRQRPRIYKESFG